MKRSIVALAAVILSGCAGQQAINATTAACAEANGRISAECVSNHPSYANLPPNAKRQVAYRVMLNEQIKNKQITEAQADVLQQEFENKILAQQNAANAAASQAASNAMATTGAALIIAGQRQPAQPVYRPAPLIRTTNCNAMGSTMNCTSF